MAYLKALWLVDGIRNKLYKYEDNELQQESYTIPVVNTCVPVGDCKVLVSTDQSNVYILSPTGYLFKFNTKAETFVKTIRLSDGSSGIAQGVLHECNTSPIFVSNYNENTVSVIMDDTIKYDIPVGLGPTNIIVDSNGTAYVCNSIENTISIISYQNCKYICYKKIRLLSNPIDVCVDKRNTLYVLCKDSKIYKLMANDKSCKRLSFDVGEQPSAITVDNQNNIIVTNYGEGTITIIDPNSIINTVGLQEFHPIAVDGDIDNNIYVITSHNIIIEINQAGRIINKFYANIPASITTLNDFTGMKTSKALYAANNPGGKPTTKDDLDELKKQLDNKIQNYPNKNAFPYPSSNPDDKALYIDDENGAIYRFDKDKKEYKVLYGTSIVNIRYDDSSETSLSLVSVNGTVKPLELKDITNTVLSKYNTILDSEIDKMFE